MNIVYKTGTPSDFNIIREIATKTWPVAYGNIISEDQIDYMLQLFYSDAALEKQVSKEHNIFILAVEKESHSYAGFTSYSVEGDATIIHKLYVLSEFQHLHLGSGLIDQIISRQTPLIKSLTLNVNRHNTAIGFYKKMGFVIIREEDNPIGKGFFMNDYVMEKKL